MRETNDYVFFWGKDDIYSNFHYSPFKHEGILFKWSEQAVMYRKAMFFKAEKIAAEILKAQTPKKCKDLGRSHQIPFVEDVWLENRERIYKEVLLDKFQLPKLKEKILQTRGKVLAEASPFDTIWGIGYDANHPNATIPSKWRGQNLLGKVLMEVREELSASENI